MLHSHIAQKMRSTGIQMLQSTDVLKQYGNMFDSFYVVRKLRRKSKFDVKDAATCAKR